MEDVLPRIANSRHRPNPPPSHRPRGGRGSSGATTNLRAQTAGIPSLTATSRQEAERIAVPTTEVGPRVLPAAATFWRGPRNVTSPHLPAPRGTLLGRIARMREQALDPPPLQRHGWRTRERCPPHLNLSAAGRALVGSDLVRADREPSPARRRCGSGPLCVSTATTIAAASPGQPAPDRDLVEAGDGLLPARRRCRSELPTSPHHHDLATAGGAPPPPAHACRSRLPPVGGTPTSRAAVLLRATAGTPTCRAGLLSPRQPWSPAREPPVSRETYETERCAGERERDRPQPLTRAGLLAGRVVLVLDTVGSAHARQHGRFR